MEMVYFLILKWISGETEEVPNDFHGIVARQSEQNL